MTTLTLEIFKQEKKQTNKKSVQNTLPRTASTRKTAQQEDLIFTFFFFEEPDFYILIVLYETFFCGCII